MRTDKYAYFTEPENVLQALSGSDPWLDQSPLVRGMPAPHLRESFGSGIDGMLWEELVVLKPWGFDLREIEPEVLLWRGGRETGGRSEFVAERVPRSHLTVCPTEGHCAFLRHWEGVLRAVGHTDDVSRPP